MSRVTGNCNHAPIGRVAILTERFRDGEKLKTKEIAREFWPDKDKRTAAANVCQIMGGCKKWFLRWGMSFGYDKAKKAYCLLDETNIVRTSDKRVKDLQGWTKRVQQEVDVGMEQFGKDPQIRAFFELAVNEIQQVFLDSRRKQLNLLTSSKNDKSSN
jgi:hypothetical protein